MRKYVLSAILTGFSVLTLSACGGGGGGATTQAVTTVYLFGQMSSVSNSKIDSLQTSFAVPTGVLVNYSSPAPAGFLPNTYPMRHGFAVPSGTVLVSASDISGSYNATTGKLTLLIRNSSNPKLALQSYTSARGTATVKGAELAKIYLKLDPPGGTPTIPVQDPFPTVYQYREPVSVDVLNGCRVNFDTKFQ